MIGSTLRWFVALLLCIQVAYGNDKVVLQLKWEHEFQFAGYYAALWQGYYDEAGLEVEIRPASGPDGQLKAPVKELVSGEADFAIGALDILVHRDRGEDLVVLAPIFQRSPHSVFALPGTQLTSVDDLAKLTVATPFDDFTRAEVQALFHSRHIDLADTRFVDDPPTISTLLENKAQAIATYSISAQYEARERGISLHELSPSEFGLDFYGDTLFTHQRVIESDPEKVERFVRASLKGWEYALTHKEEIAQRISRELPRYLFSYQDLEGYNLAFSDVIDTYMAYPYTEIGHNNSLRWERMVSNLRAIGMIKKDMDVDDLIFDINSSDELDVSSTQTLVLIGLGLLLICSFYYGRRLKYVWLLYLFALGVIYVAEQSVEAQLERDHFKDLEVDVLQQLNAVAANMSGIVNRNLAYVSGMSAHVAVNPAIDQIQFNRYSEAIFRQKPLLINLAAAPNMVIDLVYPLKGNQRALGLDYRTKADQLDVVMRVRNSGRLAVAGPIDLVQGGLAFIARAGVKSVDEFGEEYFWGILSAPFLANELYRKAGLFEPDISVDIAIRGRDGLGRNGETFYGENALFDDPRSLKSTIRVGDGTWQFAARPKEGWNYNRQGVLLLRGFAGSLGLLLFLFLLWQRRQIDAQRLYEQKIHDNEGLLREMSKVANINGWKIPAGESQLLWSSHASSILGISEREQGWGMESILELFDEHQANKLRLALLDAMEQGKSFDIELSLNITGTEHRWIRWIGNAEPGDKGQYEVTGAVQDITERKKFSEVVERQANYDLLTGLPNRSYFYENLRWSVAAAQRTNTQLAVLFIDLDKFKPVNDNYGHVAGDKLLQSVAQRVRNGLRESDFVARISGDEFTVVLRQITNEYAPIDVAEKLLTEIRKPYAIMDRQIYCGASIGISVFPDDGVEADNLISKADYAMYEVKRSGRNGCQYFTHAMQERSESRHKLYTRLQQAIADKLLYVVYQPIIDLRSGEITKCEALVRWRDTDGRDIPPSEFIALAEETSLVNEIDRFVLAEAGDFIYRLEQQTGQRIALSVNVSPRVFSSTESALKSWLQLAVDVASRVDLTIEITERMLIDGPDKALCVLNKLKNSGATIAIDDFGTGYSSLSYLTQLPIDFIKIDRSFVQQVNENKSSRMLVDTIVNLAKNLDLQLIGEGVETTENLEMLRHKGCDFAQGYLLGKPMTGDDLECRLVEESPVF